MTVNAEGLPLQYGNRAGGFHNPDFVAWGDFQAAAGNMFKATK
jgi:hypothetical protein